jgi:hypothetical protein
MPINTSNYFDVGHRIRIEVAGANFPSFDRNLNTAGNNYDETTGIVAPHRHPSLRAVPQHADHLRRRTLRVGEAVQTKAAQWNLFPCAASLFRSKSPSGTRF